MLEWIIQEGHPLVTVSVVNETMLMIKQNYFAHESISEK